jgi:hypothetical protein
VHLQLAGWRRRIDALGERHECDAERLHFLEQSQEVLQTIVGINGSMVNGTPVIRPSSG